MRTLSLTMSFCGLLLLLVASCNRKSLTDDDTGPPQVIVSLPVEREVTDYAYYVGRTEALNSVEVKARVTGYLLETPQKEGAEVKVGTVLCQIDPRTYQAQVNAAKGELEVNKAKYRLAKTENERAKDLFKENPKAISLKALDQHQAEQDAAEAAVAASESALKVHELDLEFTKVTSPIAGRMGRYEITVGNLVTENVTTLTTVVSQDPMYVYFNVDEPTMRRLLRKLFSGSVPTPLSGKVKVGMQLPDEKGFRHEGTVNFADNTVDASTGTITLRASFDNPAGRQQRTDVAARPCLCESCDLPLSQPAPAVLVAQQAIATDQGEKYVYVVNDKDVVKYRAVTLGQLQDDGLQVVSTGLSADERVIISGLQLVRPKTKSAGQAGADAHHWPACRPTWRKRPAGKPVWFGCQDGWFDGLPRTGFPLTSAQGRSF